MSKYERQVLAELSHWEAEINKNPSLWDRSAKKLQNRINDLLPEKVHQMITKSIKGMVHGTLIGSEYISKKQPPAPLSLKESDQAADALITAYRRTAAVEGAGTGAAGFLLGLADFPILLGIKMKFLFDTAGVYGYDVKDYRERLYILYIFQLTYSSPFKRKELFEKIANWDRTITDFPTEQQYLQNIDWQSLQQDYRDHIDLVKMLQMVPGFGALVGAFANFRFLDELGKTAKNCFRLRTLNQLKQKGWLNE
ncbi:EcsC family protein [Fictibacillus terranigra]|uniref:EcsC family protein n=1 Tax=Fictibacillus terranigra TaxID=3058424 RepID=A0ABT8ECZ6_9BACL|nr:EcsC family protein [Fictibacillus sp. CENA-BCM004]MDN4075732.1 EcsC family protein [Fictibacillus sp. CENA-BCM004]